MTAQRGGGDSHSKRSCDLEGGDRMQTVTTRPGARLQILQILYAHYYMILFCDWGR
jgi:hypothetical protein